MEREGDVKMGADPQRRPGGAGRSDVVSSPGRWLPVCPTPAIFLSREILSRTLSRLHF
jgi:hypothetical protein